MQDIFSLNPNLALDEVKDAIFSRINKTRAILTSVMFAVIKDSSMLDNSTLYHALWAADDFIGDLDMLFKHLETFRH